MLREREERKKKRGKAAKVAESKRMKNTVGKMNGKLNLKYAGGICCAVLGPSLGLSRL